MPESNPLINQAAVRRLAKELGRRVGADFLEHVERTTRRRLEAACKIHNGGAKTLTANLAVHAGF